MVKWEDDKNVYILGAALGALGTTISNEIIEAIRAEWRMFLSSYLLFLYPSTIPVPLLLHLICSRISQSLPE
jgi:hypothetical protein